MTFSLLPRIHFPPNAFGYWYKMLHSGKDPHLSGTHLHSGMKSRPSAVTVHAAKRRKVSVRKGSPLPSEIDFSPTDSDGLHRGRGSVPSGTIYAVEYLLVTPLALQ